MITWCIYTVSLNVSVEWGWESRERAPFPIVLLLRQVPTSSHTSWGNIRGWTTSDSACSISVDFSSFIKARIRQRLSLTVPRVPRNELEINRYIKVKYRKGESRKLKGNWPRIGLLVNAAKSFLNSYLLSPYIYNQ